jgi:hypothetical protein
MPSPLSGLPADTLLANLRRHAGAAFTQTADGLRLLGEVDRRDAWADKPYGSLFAFCLGELGWSEGEAAKKIQACRAGRRFPLLLERLAEGRLHLCGLVLLAPRLTEDNHSELIDAACGRSKRDIERLLATRFPRPDAAPAIRKLPPRVDAAPMTSPTTSPPAVTGSDRAGETSHGLGTAAKPKPGLHVGFALNAPVSRAAVVPLAAERHKLTVTIGDATRERIERIQALLSHRGPDQRSLEAVLDGALELLEAKLLKERFGVGAKPRQAQPSADPPLENRAGDRASETPDGGETSGRPEPRAFGRDDRRAIIARDGLRCTYVDPETGMRCNETRWLSLDHVVPWARGGKTTASNGRLLCGAHNRQQARLAFGDDFVRTRMPG